MNTVSSLDGTRYDVHSRKIALKYRRAYLALILIYNQQAAIQKRLLQPA